MSLNQALRTCQIRITYTPKQAQKTSQIRLKLHAKSGSNYTPNQAQNTRQIRLKLHVKSGSNYTPNQAQTTRQTRLKPHAKSCSNYTPNQAQTARQIRLKLHAKSGSNCAPNQAPNTCCMPQVRSKKERKETRTSILYRKLCCAEKATHLKSKRKASILNLGQPRKTEGRDSYICF